MKTQIPEQLKADVPHTTMGKLLLATPVVMTVIATMLAGLASSEMTRAQYDRAYAAQLQSKAGDQWNYFQAKKLRGAMQRNSVELLQSTVEIRLLESAAVQKAVGLELDSQTLEALNLGKLTQAQTIADQYEARSDEAIKAAAEAIERQNSDEEVNAAANAVSDALLAGALKVAKLSLQNLDVSVEPVNLAVNKLEKALAGGADRSLARDFAAGRMRYAATRYEIEARLNRFIALLYEVQVRKNNLSAERHHKRSGKFFFGMLAAQAAVIVSTFSLAAQKRNFLWSVAAIAGVVAIAFAVYVYLCI